METVLSLIKLLGVFALFYVFLFSAGLLALGLFLGNKIMVTENMIIHDVFLLITLGVSFLAFRIIVNNKRQDKKNIIAVSLVVLSVISFYVYFYLMKPGAEPLDQNMILFTLDVVAKFVAAVALMVRSKMARIDPQST
jgi:hypothetical protein